jgi:hypothetical protein
LSSIVLNTVTDLPIVRDNITNNIGQPIKWFQFTDPIDPSIVKIIEVVFDNASKILSTKVF